MESKVNFRKAFSMFAKIFMIVIAAIFIASKVNAQSGQSLQRQQAVEQQQVAVLRTAAQRQQADEQRKVATLQAALERLKAAEQIR
jgi:hypothetical protein